MSFRSKLFTGGVGTLTFILFAVTMVQVFFSSDWNRMGDQTFLHYVAWCITDGAIPYRDIWNVNFPLTYLIHVFVIKVFGEGNVAWRILDLSTLFAISLLSACKLNYHLLQAEKLFPKLKTWDGITDFFRILFKLFKNRTKKISQPALTPNRF